MEIVNLSPNDNLVAVIRKCNRNFKQLAWSASQSLKKQGILDSTSINAAFAAITQSISELESVTIPQAVSSEVSSQISNAYPPVGSYVMAASAPSYAGTTWSQVDSVTTDGSTVIPIWERTA